MRYTDEQLLTLWKSLTDVPFDEIDGELYLGKNWNRWEKGTPREDIWHWFDDRHSKGLYVIMGLERG